MCNHIKSLMTNITLSIPEELHGKMKHHSEIRWSEVVRKSITEKVELLDAMNKITNRSKLTKKDAREIAHKIDSSVARRLGLK